MLCPVKWGFCVVMKWYDYVFHQNINWFQESLCASNVFLINFLHSKWCTLFFFVFFFPRKLSMIKVHTPLCLDLINVVKTRRYNNLTYFWTCEWIIANQAFINLCHLSWYWQKISALLTKGIEGTLLAAYCYAMK